MAASTSKPPLCLQSQEQTWVSRGPTFHQFSNFGSSSRLRTRSLMLERRKKKVEFLVRACEQEEQGGYGAATTEEDEYFVKVLRESQPYISVHRGRVFVLLISAEIVASPYFHAILQSILTRGFRVDGLDRSIVLKVNSDATVGDERLTGFGISVSYDGAIFGYSGSPQPSLVYGASFPTWVSFNSA